MKFDKNASTKVVSWVLAAALLALPLWQVLKNRARDVSPRTQASAAMTNENVRRLVETYLSLDAERRALLESYASGLVARTNVSGGLPLVSWEDASAHVGRTVAVVGRVVASYNSGRACFLNFHEDYRNHFKAVIFKSAFGRFPANPEDYYLDKLVRVTGKIKEYQGSPEIILENPGQIEVLE